MVVYIHKLYENPIKLYVKTKAGDRKNRLLKKLPEDRHAKAKTTLPLKVTQEFLYNFPTFKAKKKKPSNFFLFGSINPKNFKQKLLLSPIKINTLIIFSNLTGFMSL